MLVTLVYGDCKICLVTDCDDLCSVPLQSPRVQVVRFAGRVASFGCVSLRSTWVRIQTNIPFQYLITETIISELNFQSRYRGNRNISICVAPYKNVSTTASGIITGSASWLRLVKIQQAFSLLSFFNNALFPLFWFSVFFIITFTKM